MIGCVCPCGARQAGPFARGSCASAAKRKERGALTGLAPDLLPLRAERLGPNSQGAVAYSSHCTSPSSSGGYYSVKTIDPRL
jgi:hypothetical protein